MCVRTIAADAIVVHWAAGVAVAVLVAMQMVIGLLVGQSECVVQMVSMAVVAVGRGAQVARALRRRRPLVLDAVAAQVQRPVAAAAAAAEDVGDHEARPRRQHSHRAALQWHRHPANASAR